MSEPKFKIGFELEGAIRPSAVTAFDAGLRRINSEIDRGTDGSVQARFNAQGVSKDYTWGGSGDEQGLGGEIRTPPLPLKRGIVIYDEICDYLKSESKRGNFTTNGTCGLHVNLSEARMVSSHKRFVTFYANLIKIFPEKTVLKMFNRSTNSYCRPIWSARAPSKVSLKALVADLVPTCHGEGAYFLPNPKYISCGLHSYSAAEGCPETAEDRNVRRVEFRCLGNDNYHIKTDLVHEALDIILESATTAFHKVVPAAKAPRIQYLRAA